MNRLLRAVTPFALVAASTWHCDRPAGDPPPATTIRMLTRGQLSSRFVAEFQRALPHVHLAIEAARSSDSVVSALQSGMADVGFAQTDAVYLAYRSNLADAPTSFGLRAIALSDTANLYAAVRRDSPLRSMADLGNRRIGVPPSSIRGSMYAQMIFAAYGLDKSAAFKEFDPEEMANHLRDGTIDAAMLGGGRIADSFVELNRSVGIRLLELGGPAVAKLRGEYPFFVPVLVEPDELPGQDGIVQTLGVESMLVCRQHLSDEQVYELTHAFFEASRETSNLTPGFQAADPAMAAATPIPLHPGAARYYREREVLQ